MGNENGAGSKRRPAELTPARRRKLLGLLDEIEAEMRRIGFWSADESALRGAFEGHLQGSFLPAARARIAGGGELPPQSNVGTAAVRHYDGCPEADRLADLCCEFDWVAEGRDDSGGGGE